MTVSVGPADFYTHVDAIHNYSEHSINTCISQALTSFSSSTGESSGMSSLVGDTVGVSVDLSAEYLHVHVYGVKNVQQSGRHKGYQLTY